MIRDRMASAVPPPDADAGSSVEESRPASGSLTVEDLGRLYRAYARRVARWAVLLGGSAIDPQDVTHEVFLALQRALPRFEYRSEHAVIGWLYRATANEVRYRRRKRRFWGWLKAAPQGVEEDSSDAPGSMPEMQAVRTPIEELESREARALVHRALSRMSERYRTLLVLFEVDGLSGEEIAQATGIRLSTVWVQLHRARAKFIEAVGRDEGPPRREVSPTKRTP